MFGSIALLCVCLLLVAQTEAFVMRHSSLSKVGTTTVPMNAALSNSRTQLQMGLFDFLKPKKSASASHILVKGPEAKKFLTDLKSKLSASKNLDQAFAQAAAEYSSCPSSKRGGSLGTFTQGQMVPAFDKVVFTEEIGVVHGPVPTPFGEHLILIESRDD